MKLNTCLLLVFLSGFTGLIYQVVWQHYLSIILGSHASATALILSVFFLFLSLGYYALGKWSFRLLKNKIFLYGVIEGVIGVYALICPNIFDLLLNGIDYSATNELLDLGTGFLVTSLFIGLPTFLMGGTIPILTQALSREFEESHKTHSLIYAVNTLGAFLGTILAGFVFIEAWGLPLTLIITGLINIFICLATYVLTQSNPDAYYGLAPQTDSKAQVSSMKDFRSWFFIGISFLSGFYVFSLESLLIRMAGISIGSSTYTYSIIVSSFILAIALGSFLVSRVNDQNLNVLIRVQSGLFLTGILLYLSVPWWPDVFLRIRVLFQPSLANFGFYWAAVLVAFIILLFIPVGLMGMNLPLMFSYIKSQREHLSKSVGKIYSINAFGSTLGASIGSYYFFNFMSADQIFVLNIILVAITIALAAWVRKEKSFWWMASALTAVILITLFLPRWKPERFSPGLFLQTQIPPFVQDFSAWVKQVRSGHGRILFNQFDPNTLATVVEVQGQKGLLVNGKPDASSDDKTVRALNALVPLSLAPKIENIFIIGLGSGLSAGIATGFPEVQHVEVSEISEGVINSLPYFSEFNYGLESRADKYKIVLGDAYRILKSKKQKYDVIICEPSNPWVTGVEKLFSYDFLKQASERLSENGLYAQWFPHSALPASVFQTILKTYQEVFPWTTLWATGGPVMILGSKTVPKIDLAKLEARFKSFTAPYEELGFTHPFSIMSLQLLPPATVFALSAGNIQIHTLEHPVLHYRAARSYFARDGFDLDQILYLTNKKPYPAGLESAKLVFETSNTKMPPEFYKDGLKITAKQSEIQTRRLRYLLKKNYPNELDDIKPEAMKAYAYLLNEPEGHSFRVDPSSKNYFSDLELLVTLYRHAVVMGLPAQAQSLGKILPTNCENDCLKFMLKQLKKLVPLDPEVQRIHESQTSDMREWIVNRFKKELEI